MEILTNTNNVNYPSYTSIDQTNTPIYKGHNTSYALIEAMKNEIISGVLKKINIKNKQDMMMITMCKIMNQVYLNGELLIEKKDDNKIDDVSNIEILNKLNTIQQTLVNQNSETERILQQQQEFKSSLKQSFASHKQSFNLKFKSLENKLNILDIKINDIKNDNGKQKEMINCIINKFDDKKDNNSLSLNKIQKYLDDLKNQLVITNSKSINNNTKLNKLLKEVTHLKISAVNIDNKLQSNLEAIVSSSQIKSKKIFKSSNNTAASEVKLINKTITEQIDINVNDDLVRQSSPSTSTTTTKSISQKEIAQNYKTKGNELYKNNSYNDAIKYYKKAQNIDKLEPSYILNEAAALCMLEKWSKTIKTCQKVLKLTKVPIWRYKALKRIATVKEKKENISEAIVYYKRAMKEHFDKKLGVKIEQLKEMEINQRHNQRLIDMLQ